MCTVMVTGGSPGQDDFKVELAHYPASGEGTLWPTSAPGTGASLSTGTSPLQHGDVFGLRFVGAVPWERQAAAARRLRPFVRPIRSTVPRAHGRAPRRSTRSTRSTRAFVGSGVRRSSSSSGSSGEDGEPAPARAGDPPQLRVVLELEDDFPHVAIVAATAEDERRLRAWLARSGVLRHLGLLVTEALDELGRREAA